MAGETAIPAARAAAPRPEQRRDEPLPQPEDLHELLQGLRDRGEHRGAIVTFTVDANDTLQTVAQRLEDSGLVSKAWMFEWYVERNGGLELLPGYFRLRPDDHMGNLMLRLKNQLRLTSAVVTHDLELMRKVADSVVFLHKGDIIYFGPVSGLDRSDHPHIQEFMAMDRVEL